MASLQEIQALIEESEKRIIEANKKKYDELLGEVAGLIVNKDIEVKQMLEMLRNLSTNSVAPKKIVRKSKKTDETKTSEPTTGKTFPTSTLAYFKEKCCESEEFLENAFVQADKALEKTEENGLKKEIESKAAVKKLEGEERIYKIATNLWQVIGKIKNLKEMYTNMYTQEKEKHESECKIDDIVEVEEHTPEVTEKKKKTPAKPKKTEKPAETKEEEDPADENEKVTKTPKKVTKPRTKK